MRTKQPKYFRSNHRINWEIYSRKHYFITISVGRFEIQFNRWLMPKD